jgi:zinc and cadmium transporter
MEAGWPIAVACGVVAGLANVVGGWLAVGRQGWDRVRQGYFMAAGAGFMLAAVFLRIVPESYRLAPLDEISTLTVGGLILAGYLVVHAAEHVLVGHFHFGEEIHHEHWVEPVVGTTALIGLGLLVAIAVFLHKIPEGFTIGSIMVASGRTRGQAILSAAWLGVATVVGVLTMTLWSGLVRYALPLSAGAALYVAASDLIPAVNEAKGVRVALGVFGGVLLFYVTETALHRLGF